MNRCDGKTLFDMITMDCKINLVVKLLFQYQ